MRVRLSCKCRSAILPCKRDVGNTGIARASRRHDRVQRAGRAARRDLEHMGVDHRGAHVGVAQQLLHRADIGAGLEKMGGKGMA